MVNEYIKSLGGVHPIKLPMNSTKKKKLTIINYPKLNLQQSWSSMTNFFRLKGVELPMKVRIFCVNSSGRVAIGGTRSR